MKRLEWFELRFFHIRARILVYLTLVSLTKENRHQTF